MRSSESALPNTRAHVGRRYAASFEPRTPVMIHLHYWPTPNGKKVTILLEELAMPYAIVPCSIGKGDQFKDEFLRIAPNNRMPAMVDDEPTDGGAPISVFESGAIRHRNELDRASFAGRTIHLFNGFRRHSRAAAGRRGGGVALGRSDGWRGVVGRSVLHAIRHGEDGFRSTAAPPRAVRERDLVERGFHVFKGLWRQFRAARARADKAVVAVERAHDPRNQGDRLKVLWRHGGIGDGKRLVEPADLQRRVILRRFGHAVGEDLSHQRAYALLRR